MTGHFRPVPSERKVPLESRKASRATCTATCRVRSSEGDFVCLSTYNSNPPSFSGRVGGVKGSTQAVTLLAPVFHRDTEHGISTQAARRLPSMMLPVIVPTFWRELTRTKRLQYSGDWTRAWRQDAPSLRSGMRREKYVVCYSTSVAIITNR